MRRVFVRAKFNQLVVKSFFEPRNVRSLINELLNIVCDLFTDILSSGVNCQIIVSDRFLHLRFQILPGAAHNRIFQKLIRSNVWNFQRMNLNGKFIESSLVADWSNGEGNKLRPTWCGVHREGKFTMSTVSKDCKCSWKFAKRAWIWKQTFPLLHQTRIIYLLATELSHSDSLRRSSRGGWKHRRLVLPQSFSLKREKTKMKRLIIAQRYCLHLTYIHFLSPNLNCMKPKLTFRMRLHSVAEKNWINWGKWNWTFGWLNCFFFILAVSAHMKNDNKVKTSENIFFSGREWWIKHPRKAEKRDKFSKVDSLCKAYGCHHLRFDPFHSTFSSISLRTNTTNALDC